MPHRSARLDELIDFERHSELSVLSAGGMVEGETQVDRCNSDHKPLTGGRLR